MIDKTLLDSIDYKILTLLTANARIPYLEIARECGISGAAIHQRIKKLEEAHVIEGTRLMINPKLVNLGVCAFVKIKITQFDLVNAVIEALKKIPEVVECHFVVGQFTMLIKLYCIDNSHLMDMLVNRILKIEGVAETSSFISLDQPIDRPVPVLDKKQVQNDRKKNLG
ncbi:transcriptional regulator [Bacteroidia bacterium]|nr:transcriptional regulator [Bacteroidia bacterium]